MLSPFYFLGGAALGWAIGGMDFAALFGAAVSSKMVKYWHGVALACVFCFAGCMIQGWKGIGTISALAPQSLAAAVIASAAAAIAITVLNLFKLPVPTSQAVVGSIAGIAAADGCFRIEAFAPLMGCWLATPLTAFVIALPMYFFAAMAVGRTKFDIFQRDMFYRIALILAGCYAAYAMGANAVANVSAVFVKSGAMDVSGACIFGGVFIAIGMITFSRRVVETVGNGIIKLDPFSALIAVVTEAVTAHFFAFIGVPVSMTQALIGAIVGIAVARGAKAVKVRMLVNIFAGWIVMPLFSFALSFGIYAASRAVCPGIFSL
ncbi:MAG: inorganic phosphate transporter family protein [bacterium]|nr:inorganic phosphate transporter family protein [bacterium]